MYATQLSELENSECYINFPAIRTFASIDALPPYLIAGFKNTKSQETETHQFLALLGAMMLLERVKLRRQSSSLNLRDITLFALTCCGPRVTLYCMKIPLAQTKHFEILSYHLIQCNAYSLLKEEDIVELS